MIRKLVRLLMVVMCFSISLNVLPVIGSHDAGITGASEVYAEDGDIASGLYNDVVPWRITSNHTLLFGEEGKAYTITAKNSYHHVFPWREYKDSIKTAKILGKISAVGNLDFMFSEYSNLYKVDLKGLDTSRVTNMHCMFKGCSWLKELDLSTFDTGKVERMDNMFEGCNNLESIDFRNFDTSSVTNMEKMFCGCDYLINLDLSSFDISNVTDMSYMFKECRRLESLDLNSFDTSNVTDMSAMFDDCRSLTSIDLRNFDTSSVKDMGAMFSDCDSLESLDLSNFNTSSVKNMTGMFDGCYSMKQLKTGSNWRYKKSIRLYYAPEFPVNMIGNKNIYHVADTDVPDNEHIFKKTSISPLYQIHFKSIKGINNGFIASFKKTPKYKISGYQIQYCKNKKFTSGVKTESTRKNNVKKGKVKLNTLKNKTTYYIRIRTFKKSGGRTIYAEWSDIERVRTK